MPSPGAGAERPAPMIMAEAAPPGGKVAGVETRARNNVERDHDEEE